MTTASATKPTTLIRLPLHAWFEVCNEQWLIERHGRPSPAQGRRDLLALSLAARIESPDCRRNPGAVQWWNWKGIPVLPTKPDVWETEIKTRQSPGG